MLLSPPPAALLYLVFLFGPARDDGAVDLPIREVTLYRSGAGELLRAGTVRGTARLRLRLPVEDLDDFLKTLSFLDLDGGGAVVRYPTQEPLARRLAGLELDLSDDPPLAQLLERMRGEEVLLGLEGGRVSGRVLGVEERPASAEPGAPLRPHLLLVTGADIRAFDLWRIASLEPADETLARALASALDALAEERAERFRNVEVVLTGDADRARSVALAYVRRMPVWKSTYRLLLPESPSQRPTLQAFAIVENTTDDDWRDVTLRLVAGRPVSFAMSLSEPLYTSRPHLAVPLEREVSPRRYEAGLLHGDAAGADRRRKDRQLPEEAEEKAVALERAFGVGGGAGGRYGGRAPRPPAPAADAEEAGGQFLFTFSRPVTLERRRSAVLPLLLAEVDARRVSILTASSAGGGAAITVPRRPARGVLLSNTTDLRLMPGPVAVLDAGRYAGDALVGSLAPGERRLLSYALDTEVSAAVEAEPTRRLRRVSFVSGALVRVEEELREVTYTLRSHDSDQARLVVVEHPRRSGFRVEADRPPSEETPAHIRFEVDLPAGGTAKLRLHEVREVETRLDATAVPHESMVSWARDGAASPEVVEAFERIRSLVQARDLLVRERESLEAERRRIGEEQQRIRENLARLRPDSDLYERYVAKLARQEDRLDAIAARLSELEPSIRQAEEELAAALENLDVP